MIPTRCRCGAAYDYVYYNRNIIRYCKSCIGDHARGGMHSGRTERMARRRPRGALSQLWRRDSAADGPTGAKR